MQTIVHYILHLIFPALIAYAFFKKDWKKVYLILLATMLIDLDHLFAVPLFDPMRCGIGFHPLHSFYALTVYFVMLFISRTRIIAIGLLFHLVTDTIDCIWIFSKCEPCYLQSKIYALFN